MAKVGPFEVEGKVRCLPHAITQALSRDRSVVGMTDRQVAASIVERVEAAIRRGMVYDQKPRGYRLTAGREGHAVVAAVRRGRPEGRGGVGRGTRPAAGRCRRDDADEVHPLNLCYDPSVITKPDPEGGTA